MYKKGDFNAKDAKSVRKGRREADSLRSPASFLSATFAFKSFPHRTLKAANLSEQLPQITHQD
jgi:hypothetical protein